jgi:hypothetical protein
MVWKVDDRTGFEFLPRLAAHNLGVLLGQGLAQECRVQRAVGHGILEQSLNSVAGFGGVACNWWRSGCGHSICCTDVKCQAAKCKAPTLLK